MKFCSVQASPESQYTTGQRRPASAAGGRYTATFISQRSVCEACFHTSCRPPKLPCCSMRSILQASRKVPLAFAAWVARRSISAGLKQS